MKRNFRLLVPCLVAMIGALGCSDHSNPNGPVATGSVAGAVTFVGTWPAAGEVRVSVYSELSPPWVPSEAPAGSTDAIQGNPTEFSYKVADLVRGEYAAIFVTWWDSQDPASTTLIGMYWAYADSVGVSSQGEPVTMPTPITIDWPTYHPTGLDIKADLDLIP